MYKDNGKLKVLKSVIIGMIAGILFCSILIFLLSFILVKSGQLPMDTVYIALQVIGALSAFVGSYIAVRIYKEYGLFIGLLTAFLIYLVVLIVGLSTCSEPLSMLSLTKLVAMLCAGAIGGVLSVNKRKNVKRYR